MPFDITGNKAKFKKIFQTYVMRPGAEKLLEMLERTDFYIAPASVKYHCHEDGGLVEHTLNVHDSFVRLLELEDIVQDLGTFELLEKLRVGDPMTATELTTLNEHLKILLKSPKVTAESVVIASHCHDFHKINFYEKKKTRKPNKDGVWEDVETWGYRDDHFILGDDGTNSWYITNSAMTLTYEEILAIENHMGFNNDGSAMRSSSGAWKTSRLALWLHMADMQATFAIED